ncbi:MAG: HIT family protein [Candidatus Nanohaloarchaea archaeon]|nr:HIT family protein [Candidatus Nanohaloarchaea archaeon]
MSDCPFCKIASHDLDSYTVYEDDETMAFLDVNPVSRGHMLVIPKTHAGHLSDLDSTTTRALFETVQKMANGINTALNPGGINILQSNGETAGQEVPHVHVHLIPRYEDDDISFDFEPSELDEDEATTLVDKLG